MARSAGIVVRRRSSPDDDYRTHVELIFECCGKCRVEIWAYSLMPNRVRLIAVPSDTHGLRRAWKPEAS